MKKEFKKGSNLEIPAKCSEKINNVTYKDLPIKKIADKAFQNVEGINSLTINADNLIVGDFAFNKCKNLTSIIFNKNISIGNSTFQECSALTQVSIKNLKSIGQSAFENCTSLGSIEISGKITGKNVFKGCTALNNVKMNNIIDIPEGLFDGLRA